MTFPGFAKIISFYVCVGALSTGAWLVVGRRLRAIGFMICRFLIQRSVNAFNNRKLSCLCRGGRGWAKMFFYNGGDVILSIIVVFWMIQNFCTTKIHECHVGSITNLLLRYYFKVVPCQFSSPICPANIVTLSSLFFFFFFQ